MTASRILCLALVWLSLALPAHGRGLVAAHSGNPATWIGEAAANYHEHEFYATDLTLHDTQAGALSRSMAPVDMKMNVSAAIQQQYQPLNLAWNIAFPIVTAIQRQIASTGHLDLAELARTLDPKVLGGSIVGSLAGGFAGAVAGATAQSALCGLGPVGAAAGFLLNPLVNFFATSLGTQFGQHVGEGLGFRGSLAQSLRDIRPIRDTGQALGVGLGYVAGQVLIPIPLVGGIIGSMVGGLIGAAIGEKLVKLPGLSTADAWMRGRLEQLARWIEGDRKKPVATGKPAEPALPATEAKPAKGAGERSKPVDRSVPNYDDVPVGTN